MLPERGAAGVLEIVERTAERRTLLTHEGVLDPAEIDPEVGELVNEERAGVEQPVGVDALSGTRRTPRRAGLGGDRVRWRAECEDVENQRLVVPTPTVVQEPRLRSPSVGERQSERPSTALKARCTLPVQPPHVIPSTSQVRVCISCVSENVSVPHQASGRSDPADGLWTTVSRNVQPFAECAEWRTPGARTRTSSVATEYSLPSAEKMAPPLSM